MNLTIVSNTSSSLPHILRKLLFVGPLFLIPPPSYGTFVVTDPGMTGTYLDHQDYTFADLSGRTTLDPLVVLPPGGSDGFLAELNHEFGQDGIVDPGWTFSAGDDLTNSKFVITDYVAFGTAAQVGAAIALDYEPGGSDPSQTDDPVLDGQREFHWIQWIVDNHNITNNPGHGHFEDIIDTNAGTGVPFYDTVNPLYTPFARPPHFGDGPVRKDPWQEHDWHAEVYLVSHIHGENSKSVTIYNGVAWGWQNRIVPEPSGMVLLSFAGFFVVAYARGRTSQYWG